MPTRSPGPISRRRVLNMLALAGATVAGAYGVEKIAGTHQGSVAPPSLKELNIGSTPKPIRRLDVTSFGAVGDGRTDDTLALNRALRSMRTGDALVFPANRTFTHREVLAITTPGVQLLGAGTLESTAEQFSALQIQASNVVIDGITLGIRETTQRWSTPDQHKLFIGAVDGVAVQNVKITGSAAAGLFCLGASNFTLREITVSDTRADGIHMTGGSTNGIVESVVIKRSGDDGVAVVSYAGDGKPCKDIRGMKLTVETTTGGRGVSVVGGTNVSYENIDVSGSSAASVYIACEGGASITLPAINVAVKGGRIRGANTNSAIDHGAILIYSGRVEGAVRDVTVSDLVVSGTRSTASRQIGVIADGGDAVNGVRFINLTLAATPQPYQGNAPSAAYVLTGVTADRRPVNKGR